MEWGVTKKVTLIKISLILLSIFIPLTASAQSTLRIEGGSSPDYLAGLAQLFDAANRIDPESFRGEGALLRITPEGELNVPDMSILTSADRELAETARRIFNLYKSIGGQPGPRALLFQRTKHGLFFAREGSTGTLSATLQGAMGGALGALASGDATLPATAQAWLPHLASAIANPGSRPPQNPVARIPRHQPTVITLTGPEIARAGADAILTGPQGSTINIIRSVGGQLQARVVFTQETPEGFSKLYLYSGSDALNAVADFDVTIGSSTEGGARAAAPDDHGATRETATPLLQPGVTRASLPGQIGASDDVDMFRLSVSAPGSLAITSRGSSDVTARLLDARGNPVAVNDDGGAGYNFGLQTPVSPGNYLLSVEHCCGGGGNYQIDTDLTPQ